MKWHCDNMKKKKEKQAIKAGISGVWDPFLADKQYRRLNILRIKLAAC